MIEENTIHETEAKAREHGQKYKDAWGWAYNPYFRVYQNSEGQWVCNASRWSSCD